MNRKLKQKITMILTLILITSSVPSFGASARFKDVPRDHWSYPYVEDMAKLGYLSGYEDGTFEPSERLTFIEAMSALSRFVEPTPVEKENAINGYGFLLDELEIKPTWEREGISIALDMGIISENELRNAKRMDLLGKPIQREVISVFLAKALGLEEEAREKNIIVLPFRDAEKVETPRVRYIDVLLDAGVLSPEGKGDRIFDPKSTLTRAEMATLLSKSYDYVEKNPIKEEPKEDKPQEEEPVVEEEAKGIIKKINTSSLKMTLEYRDGNSLSSRDYTIDSGARVYLDGKSVYLKDLKEGSGVQIKSKNKLIYDIEATSKIKKVEGVIIEISPVKDSKDPYVSVTLEDKDKVVHKFYTDSGSKIYRKNKSVQEKDLKLKDFAYIEGEYDLQTDTYLVNVIDSDVDVKKIKGYVTRMEIGLNQNTLVTVKNLESSKEEVYELTRNAYISLDGKMVSSLPGTPGYYVEIVVENDEIVEIYVDSKSLEKSIMGKIRSIDYDKRIIYLDIDNLNYDLEDYGKETTIYSDSKVRVSDRNLRERNFRDLSRGDKINVVGIKDGTSFIADTIEIR